MMKFCGLSKSWLMIATVAVVTTGMMSGRCAAQEGEYTDLVGDNYKEHWETTGNWVQENGEITLEPREGESGWSRWDAYLWSERKYDDFEIQFEYKPQDKSNSGFYFRVADKNDPVAQGIEVQTYDSHGKPDDKLTDHDSGGIIPRVPPTKNAAKPAGEWSKFEITSKDDMLTVKLNGEVVNKVDLTKPPFNSRPDSGYIGFQDHALPLSLRNIKIREL